MSDGSDKIVVCHGPGCTDGFAASWLLKLIYPKAQFHYCQPEDSFPVTSLNQLIAKDVIVADVTFSRKELEWIHQAAKSLVVLDHHIGNNEKLAGLPFFHFDNDRSGAHLVLDHFRPEIENYLRHEGQWIDSMHQLDQYAVESLIMRVCDHDRWAFKLEGTRAVHAALSSYPQTFESWNSLMAGRTNLKHLIGQGEALIRYRSELVERVSSYAVKKRKHYTVKGESQEVDVWIVNSPVLQSEICEKLYTDHPEAIAATWFDFERDGVTWRRYSFRSAKNGPSVLDFAACFGGGGHHRSSGLTTKEPIL